jgi:hypothetical protein
MAEEEGAKNNKLIAIIAGVALVIVAAVVGIIMMNKNKGEVLNDDFFKTGDDKVVISNTANSDDPTVAKKVHQVYFVNGDKITGLKVYSEFESEQAAKDADAKPEVAEAMKTGMYKDHKVQGKFIIVTMSDSVYGSLTVEQLRATAAALEQTIQNGVDQQAQTTEKSDDKSEGKTTESEESEEESEEE